MKNLLLSNHPLNKPVAGIVEYDLLGFDTGEDFNSDSDLLTAQTTMRDLYELILKQDPLWHFLFEGTFNVLRVSKKFKKQIEEFFRSKGIVYRYKGPWGTDDQKATAEFQTVFTYIFHGFSVLAMETKFEDIFSVADRVYHCYNLSNIYNILKKCDGDKYNNTWEPRFISENAIGRSFYEGRQVGYIENKDKPESKNGE